MVDTSLRNADEVVIDNQSVRGELWTMRNARWLYWPLEVEIVYHILHGFAEVVVFHFREQGSGDWKPIFSTDEYREILTEADRKRAEQP